ncbi:MAG TPA: YraN family protein [Gemmatimonadales bacterium]|nr:YraN family protein [Gemmatimonadales bacterium]
MPTRKFVPTREWEDERQLRGLAGERAAMAYLISCGWSIEAHRFRLGRHDIDLIARRGRVIAFVEVKTRRSAVFGEPVEAVGRRKREAIARVAELWRLRYGRPDDEYRFDLVAVWEAAGGGTRIEHVADAWRGGGR